MKMKVLTTVLALCTSGALLAAEKDCNQKTTAEKQKQNQVLRVAKRFRLILNELEAAVTRFKPERSEILLGEIVLLQATVDGFVVKYNTVTPEETAALIETVEQFTCSMEGVVRNGKNIPLVERLSSLTFKQETLKSMQSITLLTQSETQARCEQLLTRMKIVLHDFHDLTLSRLNRIAQKVESVVTDYSIDTAVMRILPYVLFGAYVLRQQSTDTVSKWQVPGLLALKKLVGSPSERKPAFTVTYNPDVSAREQIEWAKANGCKTVEIDDNQENAFAKFLKRFGVKFLDGPVGEVAVTGFFLYRVKEDLLWLRNKGSGLFAALLNKEPQEEA